MSETGGDGLDGLVMGSVSEDAKESDEQVQARIAAAQIKIRQIKKDESHAKGFDDELAKLVPAFSKTELDIVIFLINHEIPSLTVLGILSIANDQAGKICFTEFEKFIESRADFTEAKLPVKIEEKISYWWTFIYGANHISKTTKFAELKNNEKFVKTFAKHMTYLLKQFLQNHKVENFDMGKLKAILQKYQKGVFEPK